MAGKPPGNAPEDAAEQTQTNYNVYRMRPAERGMYIVLAAAVLFALGFIFYRSPVIAALLTPLALLYPRIRTKQLIAKRKRQLQLQFQEMLYSLSSAIGAGSSVANAIDLVLDDMERQYFDKDTFIIKELELMSSRIAMNRTVEEVFADFAERSGLDDVRTFASIFEIAKRTGGNLIEIIRQASTVITEKIEIKQEMETMLAGKKFEQKVLSVIPVALIWILTETTTGFMDPIFTTPIGRVVATIALVIIALGYFWSRKIAEIEV